MRSQRRGVGLARMLEIIEQAFLVHQPLGKGQVTFEVLRGDAALRINVAVLQIETPGRDQFPLAAVSRKYRIEDIGRRHVLEYPAVASVREEGRPGFDRQLVTRQATVRARQFDGGNVAVERT